MPSADGVAPVNSKRGAIEIEAEFGNLQKPTIFGNEYLTYILWAISPEGRAVNLGEVLVGGNSRSKLKVTTDLQAFALIVTAEPYDAVRQPSNVVVLENIVREDTKGTIESMNTKYELLERGGYIPTGYKFDPVVLNTKLPLEFFEARNALRIAESEGAEQYASDSYQHAERLMNKVDEYATRKHVDRKPLIAVAREAVQTAEDAREITVKKIDEQRLDNERQTAADAQARTQEQADDATRQKERAPKPSSPNPVQSRTPPTHNLLGDRRSRIQQRHKLPELRPSQIQPAHKPLRHRQSPIQQGPRPNLRKPSRTPTGPDQIWLTIRLLRQVPYPLPRRTPNNRG
jgi:hypothetical protein